MSKQFEENLRVLRQVVADALAASNITLSRAPWGAET